MAKNARGRRQMRITDKHPTIQWANVWTNIHHPAFSDSIKSTWYVVVHDIVPTNERLAVKRITDIDRRTQCDRLDTLTHRIISCQEEEGMWTWTKGKIAQILRIDPRHIPAEWALRPTLKVWPPQRHAAIIWILAHFMAYKLQGHRCLTLLDYTAYLRRKGPKQCDRHHRKQQGNI
jgi:hypothetical protein